MARQKTDNQGDKTEITAKQSAKQESTKEMPKSRALSKIDNVQCDDKKCPVHGKLSIRGRMFKGYVKKIIGDRATIEWERIIYIPKYERYMKKKSKVHAHIPACSLPKVKIGSYVKIGECRPLSKIIHFVVLEVIR